LNFAIQRTQVYVNNLLGALAGKIGRDRDDRQLTFDGKMINPRGHFGD
jgi:hypothetical protein